MAETVELSLLPTGLSEKIDRVLAKKHAGTQALIDGCGSIAALQGSKNRLYRSLAFGIWHAGRTVFVNDFPKTSA